MKFIIVGRNIEVTPGLRAAVEEKIGKLERYFNPDTEAHVTLSVEKERQKIEVTIPVKGNIIRSEQVSNDMYVSIDLVEEIIERQLKKYKNKIQYVLQLPEYTSSTFGQDISDMLSKNRTFKDMLESKSITIASRHRYKKAQKEIFNILYQLPIF